jgi:hypothetical protein
VPEAPEHRVSRTGDLWLLGQHRLLCGDSTVAIDVERALGGVEPHLMVTDPPHGVNYDPAAFGGPRVNRGVPRQGVAEQGAAWQVMARPGRALNSHLRRHNIAHILEYLGLMGEIPGHPLDLSRLCNLHRLKSMDVHYLGSQIENYVSGMCRLRRPIDGSRVIYAKFSISIIYKSRGAVCRLHYPRRLFGAGARR